MLSCAIVSLTLAASALANVFLTSPVASSVFTANQIAEVNWQDDGTRPSLPEFGNASFVIYVGNAILQTPLQILASSVNVSATSSLQFTPKPDIGPDSGEYFIRVTSLSFRDPSSPQYFAEEFSAKFTLTGMTGTFNSSVQAEIDGQSTAPIGAPSASSGTPGTTAVQQTTNRPTSSAASSAQSSSTPAANGAGKPVIATGFVALAAMLTGATLL